MGVACPPAGTLVQARVEPGVDTTFRPMPKRAFAGALSTTSSTAGLSANTAETVRPVALPNRDGDMLTPSVIYLDGAAAVVGQAARDVALERPDQVAALIKRRMGHPTLGQLVAAIGTSGPVKVDSEMLFQSAWNL